jgi:inosose dehydratase
VDTGHITYAGGNPVAMAKRHAKRVNHVHCKDVRLAVLKEARAKDWSFLDAVLAGVFTVPGDGGVDFAAFAKLLASIRYGGWVVVEAEQDPAKAPPFQYAQMGHDHLTKLFTEARITIAR